MGTAIECAEPGATVERDELNLKLVSSGYTFSMRSIWTPKGMDTHDEVYLNIITRIISSDTDKAYKKSNPNLLAMCVGY